MNAKEIDRAALFAQINGKGLTQAKAAEKMGLSLRQVQRLFSAYKNEGPKALISKKRGKPSNNKLPDITKRVISEIITSERYTGFGPTLMSEKLEQYHGIEVSVETVRQLMLLNDVWVAKLKKRPVIHQQRLRRARWGELVQIDGSPHAWFENRADPCVLIVFIDDATGRTYGKFFEAETTAAYMTVTEEYIKKNGRMRAVYSDKYGVFRINQPGCTKRECLTQYGRALKELDIELICANSPQAKGRVERANQTLQDRLVKEMRLAGICSIEQGNAFLESYWEQHNEKFSVTAREDQNAHRDLALDHQLRRILCVKDKRKVTKNLEIQHNNVIYQILDTKFSPDLRGATVTVLTDLEGCLSIEYKGKELRFQDLGKQKYAGEIKSSKEVERFLKGKERRPVAKTHPWKQGSKKAFAY